MLENWNEWFVNEGKPIIYGMPLEEQQLGLRQKAKEIPRAEYYGTGFTANVTSLKNDKLAKLLIKELQEEFTFPVLNERIKQQSTDGTRKFLELADGLLIETALMPQEYGLSICVTTQVGCNIGAFLCQRNYRKQCDSVGEIVCDARATYFR